jgi:AcrR family transcriptional regulator
MVDTKQRILDTAERLFGEQGFGATSLRNVISNAGVNVAAVHYHFGTKEELLDNVIRRKLEPLNRERLALLDRAVGEKGNPRVDRILEAFLRPAVIQAGRDPAFCKLMGRLHAEGMMPAIVSRHFQEVAARFVTLLRKAASGLTDVELAWRIHFVIGTMAHSLQGPPRYPGIGDLSADPEAVLRRMVAFLSAGFRAPAVDAMEVKQ